MRTRSLPTLVALAALVAASVAYARAGAQVDRYVGVAATRATNPAIAATLAVRPIGARDRLLEIDESLARTTLRDYAIEMTKTMHLIAISDDFATFDHLHPSLDPGGHFTVVFRAPKAGGYHLYADAAPRGFGQQVFRFDVPVAFGGFSGSGRTSGPVSSTPDAPALAPTSRTARTGRYAVSLDTLDVRAASPATVHVAIARDGRPANDLRPYLGGAAHAVFIDAATLAYVHVHPTTGNAAMHDMAAMGAMADMDDASTSAHVAPQMTLHVGALARGTYKLWLQFRGGDGLHVAPFVLHAR